MTMVARTDIPCPACGGTTADPLPIPVVGRGMVSDGRILPVSLDKRRCLGCGLIRHSRRLDAEEVRAIYAGDYALPSMVGAAEDARGLAYARTVAGTLGPLPPGSRLLDVGCGSGAMLKALGGMVTAVRLIGIDPALPDDSAVTETDETGPELRRGLPDRDLVGVEPFDAITSINTIEHAADPVAFLATLRALLRPGGRIVLVCPAATPANNELLFHDHLWTIPPAAMARIAAAAGLGIREHRPLTEGLAGFHLFLLAPGAGMAFPADVGRPGEATAYLAAWRDLDGWLMRALDGAGPRPVQAFGAGQMAALLRAYAPGAWSRVERLVLDRPAEAWPLAPLAAVRYDAAETPGWMTLIAVHPGAQSVLADRIRADGGTPLILPPSIRH